MAGILNITIDQGETYTNTNSVFLADGVTAMNLTGYTVASKMRKHYTSTASHTINTTITNPATNGLIDSSLSATETSAITAGYYVYDLEITSSGGVVTRVVEGKVHMKPGVTR
tara:strand:- start:96 stop:434 length:339 start_codon:yes stop_codon:yes gene_type:complete